MNLPWARRQEQVLAQVDGVIIREATQIENWLKNKLSKEAQAMAFEVTAWNEIKQIINGLKGVLTHLKISESGGPVGKTNHGQAEALLSGLVGALSNANANIEKAVSMDAQEIKIAKAAAKQLNDIHSKLITEAARITLAKGWT